MPFAGVALVTVGRLGPTCGVQRGLANVVVAVDVVMLVLSLSAIAPA
jgi:hypothetical protein